MADQPSRRSFLNRTLLGVAGAGAMLGFEEQILATALAQGAEPPAAAPPPGVEPLPCGQIGNLKISRMVIGGNLIGGWAHSRDLLYVSKLFQAYNTDDKVAETLALGEQYGINTILIDPLCQAVVEKYKKERGGKIQTLVCMHPDQDLAKMRDECKRLVDNGATLLYTHGEVTDHHTMAGRIEVLAKSLEAMKSAGVPAGIGSHSLETPIACEKDGLPVDFYVKTYHLDRYWSATPKDQRKEWCWYKPREEGEGRGYHDNMWCLDSEKTADFFEKVEKPWFAFKTLAAGAIHPQIGFPAAFRAGADFIVVGMFDFQLAQDVQIAHDAVRKTQDRKRPWRA